MTNCPTSAVCLRGKCKEACRVAPGRKAANDNKPRLCPPLHDFERLDIDEVPFDESELLPNGGCRRECDAARLYEPANDNDFLNHGRAHSLIVLPSDKELGDPRNVQRMACRLVARCEKENLSRRDVLNFIADQLNRFLGPIRTASGDCLCLCFMEVDRIFREESQRWLSDFMKFSEKPPQQAMQGRTIDRLRLLALALAIVDRLEAE